MIDQLDEILYTLNRLGVSFRVNRELINEFNSELVLSILAHLIEMYTPSKGLSLDRNPPLKANIACNPKYFYRCIGEGGFEDSIQSKEFRANPNANLNSGARFVDTFFEKGRVNNIYRKGASYILESVDCEKIVIEDSSYPKTKSGNNLTYQDKVRVWKRINEFDYEVIFDSILDGVPQIFGLKVELITL